MDRDDIIAALQAPLDTRHVKPPPKGKYGEYIEGWRAIAEANRIFGHDGWSYDITRLELTNDAYEDDKHHVGYMCCVKLWVGMEGSPHRHDVGHGQGHSKSAGDAHDSAIKEAVTDALKRALRTFGNPFGLALYDKEKANVVDVGAEKRAAEAAVAKQQAAVNWAADFAAKVAEGPAPLNVGKLITGNASAMARAWQYDDARQIIEGALKPTGVGFTIRDGVAVHQGPKDEDDPARLMAGG